MVTLEVRGRDPSGATWRLRRGHTISASSLGKPTVDRELDRAGYKLIQAVL